MSYLAQPVSLELRNTAASISVPTSTTVLVVPTIVSSVNIDYNNSTGVITLHDPQTYVFDFMFNASSSLGATLNISAEQDTGSGFNDIAFSGRMATVAALSNQQILFSSTNYFSSGTKLRLRLWSTGTMTLVTSTLPTSTVQVPAVRILATN